MNILNNIYLQCTCNQNVITDITTHLKLRISQYVAYSQRHMTWRHHLSETR